MNKKSNKKIKIIIVLAVVIVLSTVIAVSGVVPSVRLKLAKGGTVQDGVLPNVTQHISDVPVGEIRYLINKNVVFKNTYSCGNVMLENPESCEYDLKFLFYLPDGKLIYTSPLISPGQYLVSDKLSDTVEPGEYACAYSAQAYSDGEFKGETTGIVTISIG